MTSVDDGVQAWTRFNQPPNPEARHEPLPLVLVLLPPSQGKASPDRGRRVGLSTLAYSRLREPRGRLIAAVDPGLLKSPAIPAAELYTGVLAGGLRVELSDGLLDVIE